MLLFVTVSLLSRSVSQIDFVLKIFYDLGLRLFLFWGLGVSYIPIWNQGNLVKNGRALHTGSISCRDRTLDGRALEYVVGQLLLLCDDHKLQSHQLFFGTLQHPRGI